jgi:hypothetical protein
MSAVNKVYSTDQQLNTVRLKEMDMHAVLDTVFNSL